MAWKDDIPTRIPDTTSVTRVEKSRNASSTILFAKGGNVVRQVETEVVSEYRGLTKERAVALAGVEDSTAQTAYYRVIGGTTYSMTATSGTRTTKAAQRANEADGWVLTVSETTFTTEPAALVGAGWTDSLIGSSASSAWSVRSRSKSVTPVREFNGCTLFHVKDSVVEEMRYLTKDAAAALVSNPGVSTTLASKTATCTDEAYYSTSSSGGDSSWHVASWCYATLNDGVQCYASMSFVSDTEGYTVTRTTETYSGTQAGNRRFDVGTTPNRVSWSW